MAKATGAILKMNDSIYTNGMLDQQKKNCKNTTILTEDVTVAPCIVKHILKHVLGEHG